MVSHILNMHQEDYEYLTKLLFDTDPHSPTILEAAPIFTAANIGSPKLFEALIIHSKIPSSIILRQKQECTFSSPDGTVKYHVDTPLSLILSRPENYSLIDTLVDLDESDSCKHLTSIDLSYTRTRNLPMDLFKLRHLYRINISNNKLSTLSLVKLPQKLWPNLLRDLNVSYNSLEQIPLDLFELPVLETLNVSHNSLKFLPEQWWNTKSISQLDISFNIHLESLSLKDVESSSSVMSSSSDSVCRISGGVSRNLRVQSIACRMNNSRLKNLNASHCSINKFPRFLALFFPNLDTLNLSHNKLLHCCAINELPTSLESLDVSNNLLNSHSNLFHIDHDLSTKSSYMVHKDLTHLCTLKLANNVDLRTVTFRDETETNNCHVFFPKLLRLDLSNCNLQRELRYLGQLQNLTDLDISGNKDLYIPNDIINLESLIKFTYDGIKDPIVDELNCFTLIREKLVCLHGRK